MSRSYKKPYCQSGGSKYLKKVCSRKHRRAARQILKPWRYTYTDCWAYGCEEGWHWAPWDDREYEEGYCGMYCNCRQFVMSPEPIFPTPLELMNPYDICDYRCYYPQDPKSYRK